MKMIISSLFRLTNNYICLLFLSLFLLGSCKKDKKSFIAPTVTTSTPTDLTPSAATVGGNITSDGGTIITAAGICYSTTNATPTVDDSTIKTAVLSGSFTNHLEDLLSNTKYYIRAYATNQVGTAYGEVMNFTTGNEAPTATNLVINGEIKGDIEIELSYQYNDKEGDVESGTIIQWYRADDATGTNMVSIEGATNKKYRINPEDEGKVIWVSVTPKTATGTQTGTEVISEKKGPVGEATTVTFMYNGHEVTYGIINSSKTSRRWLDRNLGAANAPTAYNNYANYGDLFQWGRLADGHQLVIRTANAGDPTTGVTTAVNPNVTLTTSPADTPANNLFIQPADAPYDWRTTINNTLWQGVNGTNNPCPKGWYIPSIDEWNAEELTGDPAANFTQLHLTISGSRNTDGSFSATTTRSYYWTSSISESGSAAAFIVFNGAVTTPFRFRAFAAACRCIKN